MLPDKTRGICGHCHEPNPYTETNCVRCNSRLAWAFLIDGKSDSEFLTPSEKFVAELSDKFAELVDKLEGPINHPVQCRYCDQVIAVDEKICPHCGQWLVSVESWSTIEGWPVVDSAAPEIQRLIALHRKKQQEE